MGDKNAREDLDGGGLARPVGSDITHHLAGFNRKADMVHRMDGQVFTDNKVLQSAQDAFAPAEGAEFLHQILNFNNGWHAGEPHSPMTLINTRLAALAIELGVIDLLPGAEVELAVGDRHHGLVPDQQAFQVGITIVLARVVVAVFGAKGREFLQPLVDVGDQTVFRIVHVNARGDVHGRDQDQAFLDLRLGQRLLNILGDIDELPMFLRVEPQIFRM